MFGPLMWSLLNAAATILTPFILFTVLAQTAEAWQVGAIGIAISILELLKSCAPQGLYEILLRREIEAAQKSAAFGLLLSCGILGAGLYCGLVVLTSHHIPDFQRIMPALLLLAPKLLLDVAAVQPQAEVARRQALRRLALRTVVANGVAAATGAALSIAGEPLLGLITYYLIQSVLGFLLVYLGQSEPVKPSLRLSPLAGLLHEAGYATGVRLVGAGNNYADTLIVAAFVPPATVGSYNLGKRLETAVTSVASSLGTMLFQPSYAKGSEEERDRTTETSVKITTLLFGIPVVAFTCFNRELISFVFGAKWIDAGPVCALLAISGVVRTYGALHGSLLSVNGNNRILLINAISSASAGFCIVAGFAHIGLFWVALGLVMKNVVFSTTQARMSTTKRRALVQFYLRNVFRPLAVTAGLAALSVVVARAYGKSTGMTLPSAAPILLCGLLVCAQIVITYRNTLALVLKRLRRTP